MQLKKLCTCFFISIGAIIFFLGKDTTAQNTAKIDSLLSCLKNSKQDSINAKMLISISKEYWGNDPSKALYYATKSLQLSSKSGYKKGIADAYNSFGAAYDDKGNYHSAIYYYTLALNLRKEINDFGGQAWCYNNIGEVYRILGNYPEAIKNNYAALTIREKADLKNEIAVSYNNIGNIYLQQNKYKEALGYYFQSLKLLDALGNDDWRAYTITNIANIYKDQGNFQKALKYYTSSLAIYEEVGDKNGLSSSYHNIGNVYTEQNKLLEGLKYYTEALKLREELEDKDGLGQTYISLGNNFVRQKKYTDATNFLEKGLGLSKEVESFENMFNALVNLAKLDSLEGNYKNALFHYQQMIQVRDSMFNQENTKKIVQTQMQYEFDKKESATKAEQEKKDVIAVKELQKQKLVRNGFVGGFAVVLLFAGVFFTQRNKIKKGKQLSDELLLNILPSEVAEELKAKGSADAKQFDEVTVMFTDFKGFTQISEKLTPSELVAEIHTCFKAFDDIITKHNIEKIKTIGDAYMCAGGLPMSNTTHASDVVQAALEIRDFMQSRINSLSIGEGRGEVFEIRIGIHTGPVVAGIVGVKKFAYDIWGDTVNIASRMESSGEAGKVNISGSTYELVKDKFRCIHRGKIQAKNKGEVDMYFVEAI